MTASTRAFLGRADFCLLDDFESQNISDLLYNIFYYFSQYISVSAKQKNMFRFFFSEFFKLCFFKISKKHKQTF